MPRNLKDYSPADEAARGLEQIAADIRSRADIHPLVRWNINMSFWHPEWAPKKKAEALT